MSCASNAVNQTEVRMTTQTTNLLATASWPQTQHHVGSEIDKILNESSSTYGKFKNLYHKTPEGYSGDKDQIKPKCPECGKIYSNNSNLKQHIVNLHSVPSELFSCPVCQKTFKTRQYMQIHLLSIHGIRQRKTFDSNPSSSPSVSQ